VCSFACLLTAAIMVAMALRHFLRHDGALAAANIYRINPVTSRIFPSSAVKVR